MGRNPPTQCNTLQAQQRISCEPGKKNLLKASVCEGICSEGGFFAETTSYSPVLSNVAAKFPKPTDPASQHMEKTGGSWARLPDKRNWTCFHVPGIIALKTRSQALCLRRLLRTGQTNVPQMVLWRWSRLDDLSNFFSSCFLQLCHLSFEEWLLLISNPK